MKITLVHTPISVIDPRPVPIIQPPLGMAYVAASLRERGHVVRVVDGLGEGIGRQSRFDERFFIRGLPVDEIVERVDFDTDVIGLGILFSNFWPLAKAVIRALRERFPDTPIVLGGEHVTALPEFVLGDAPVDYLVIGEGEETALELMAELEANPERPAVDAIPGLAYRRDDGTIAKTPRRRRQRKLDEIPWPAWDLFPMDRYLEARLFTTTSADDAQRPMPILATRGCPYTCTYCSSPRMWGTNYFMRSPKDVVDEMETYVHRYGATDFHFQDLTPIINARWAHELCDEIIGRKLSITWKPTSGTRSEAIDLPLLRKMQKSGLDELCLAPESGSPEVIESFRKRSDIDRILSVARMVRDNDIDTRVTGFMIIGEPDERLRDVLQTYRYLFRMARSGFDLALFNRFAPYPGSELHDRFVREGKIVHGDDYFLRLDRHFSLASHVSWHPRWSGRFVLLLLTIAYLVFFGTYYLSKPIEGAKSLLSVLCNRPRTRFERQMAYRLWQPLQRRRRAATA